MEIIWLLIKASRRNIIVAILVGLSSGACSARLIALINSALLEDSPRRLLMPFIALAILIGGSSSLSAFLLVDLAQDSVYRLRLQLSRRILSAPLQQLEQLGPSQLMATLTKDVQAISDTVFSIPFLCVDIAVLAGCLIYLSTLSGWAFLLIVTFLITAVILVQLLANYAYHYLSLARKAVDQLFQHFRGITDGTKELKLHAIRRELFFEKDLTLSAATSRDYTKTALKLAAIANNSGQFLFFILIGLLLFWAPQTIPNIQPVLPAYILTMTFVLGPIESIIQRIPNLANANVSIRKVNAMGLQLSERAEFPTTVITPVNHWKTLSLQNVIHTYTTESSEQPFTLGPIDLTVQSGELVFIVGGNGSGKSTLAKIITALYSPESGELRLDEQPITENNREQYRQLFSAVFSDFYLFDRLVSTEMLSLDQQAKSYLTALQLDGKVSVKDGQLSTTALSQGQRKRIALLAAYLEDRPIYLFDEWAADQDPMFREIFYTQLLPQLIQRGKTIFAISHDDHYFHLADRIIKLNYGQIESDSAPQPK